MTMKTPRIRLGNDDAWVELVQTGGDNQTDEENWRVTADWCSWMTADFPAYLSVEEATDFAARMLSHLRHPSGLRFSTAVTSGRNNPLTLTAEPVEDGYAFLVYLTPHGDDNACHLQMEINPIDTTELCNMFDALQASLMVTS
ncbi:hypothetical protein ABUW04_13125 [Streptacidiphilus sp. N1-10]|uniref:Uncharacterized protein n=2 Tax=Streptacidiphilus jeojiensis TaxID=3229225 RepID=A0ABV6XLQ5_9ACTN